MNVGGAEGVAVVQQRGVDQHVVLWIIHQILQVAQVTVAASNAVPSAVLIQDEHLTGTEPTLKTKHTYTRPVTLYVTTKVLIASPGGRRLHHSPNMKVLVQSARQFKPPTCLEFIVTSGLQLFSPSLLFESNHLIFYPAHKKLLFISHLAFSKLNLTEQFSFDQ